MNLTAVKLLTQDLHVLLVAAVRMTLAAAVLLAVARWQGLRWPRLRPGLWALATLAAFFLVYQQQVAFAQGLATTSATNAALVMALGPLVSVLLEALAFRRGLRPLQLAGAAVAIGGVAIVVLLRPGARLADANAGDLWILLSVLGFACGGLCMQRLAREMPPLLVSLYAHLVGSAMLWAHAAVGVPDPLAAVAALGPQQWALVAYSGVLATAAGAVAWARGIAALGVGRTAAYLSWIPVFGLLFGVLVLGESLTPWHVLGLGCVLVGSRWGARR